MPLPSSLRAKTKKQTCLAFSPLPSSSPAKEQYSAAVQTRLANVRHTGSKDAPASSPPELRVKRESNLPTPEPSSQADRAASSKSQSSSEEDALPSTKRRRLARRAGDREFEQSTPTRKPTRLTRGSTAKLRSKDDVRRASDPRKLASSSDDGSEFAEAEADAVSELGEPETTGDEDDDVLVTKPTQRRRQLKKAAYDPFIVHDDQVEYISSDNELPSSNRRKPKKQAGEDWLAADDEIEYITSNDETPPSSLKKSKKARLRRRGRHEQEELEDDLADLRDSEHSDDGVTKTPRTRGGPVTTQRDKARQHFELLKRRRAGEKIPRVLDSNKEESDDEPEPVDLDNITNDELLGAPHVISDDSSVHGDDAVEDRTEEAEDDFVVDDVSSRRLGLPHPDIPLEFTSYASAKPKDLFLHVIEWLLKNRIAPAFNRDDPLYKLALSKVSDQVTAQAGSRLISAAWNAEFKYAILARPDISMTFLEDADDMHTCDACNRVNHPAQYDFVLTGEPYKKRDLEPVNDDSDDEDEEKQEYDEAGHLLPSPNTHFYLGRYCAANAEMGHKLVHWQYHLNQNLLGYLEEQGVLSAEATLARDKMNGKRREKEAEAIVDSMQETGVIKALWRAFQRDLDDARLGMEDFEKRGKRGQGRIGTVRSTGKDGLIREWNKDTMTIVGRAESDDED